MAKNITMPQMGFDMTEGVIANWLKKEGEAVSKGEPVAEIETDKTTIQIEAFDSGVLAKILAQTGAKVPVGETIGIIAAPGEKVDVPNGKGAAPAPAAPQAESPRPTETPAPSAATATATPAPAPAPSAPPSAAAVVNEGRVIATPVAKRIAEERGIDLRYVKGTGPEGRITKSDVEGFVMPVSTPAPTPTPAAAAPVTTPVTPPAPAHIPAPTTIGGQKKPFTRMRQTIATRMVASKTQVPHFYITVAVEMDAAMALRAQINESLKPEGVKISVNDMVIRAVALALRRFPNMNASYTPEGIEMHDHVHVGNAVTVEGGLVTVTVRDTDTKTLKQISQDMSALADRARNNKMQAGDVGGQTFTISNLGMYGVENFIAIVNQPDAGILAVATATPTPVVRDGQSVIRTIMKITISGDHRVTDGAEGAQFLNEVKRLLETPWSLVL